MMGREGAAETRQLSVRATIDYWTPNLTTSLAGIGRVVQLVPRGRGHDVGC